MTTDTFDLEKEAYKVYPYDSEHRDRIIEFGRRCMNEAFERAAKIGDKWMDGGDCHDSNPCCHVRTAQAYKEMICELKSPPPVLKDSKNER